MIENGSAISMKKSRLAGGLLIAVALTVVLVPLCIACLVIAGETPLNRQQFVRMSRVRDALFVVCFVLQIAAGWLIHSSSTRQRSLLTRILRVAGFSAASLACSLTGGLVLSGMEEHGWYGLAAKLFM
jgi:hypothetical protein